MTISISIGCCFDLKLNKIESIHFLEKYSNLIDGVELIFATPKELIEFELDKKSATFLKSKKFITIHMPLKEIIYKKNSETKKLLKKATNLAKKVNAQYLLFHPIIVSDFSALQSPIQICIENMDKKSKEIGYTTVQEMQQLFDKHPTFGFVLDISHVLSNNINPSDFLILKNKIKAIHSSGQWIKKGTLREHGFLTEGDNKQLEKVKPILNLNIPKIIECDFYPEKIPLIEKEIQLLKQLKKR